MLSKSVLSLIGFLILYCGIQLSAPVIRTGDHGVYTYAAYLLSNGTLPYRDFFFSHPPLQLLPQIIALRLFGVNFFVLNLIPMVAGMVSGILTYCIARRSLGNAGALVATFFFLFSALHLLVSLSSTGQNIALVFVLLSAFFLLGRKHLFAGAILGFGIMSSINVAVALIVFAIFSMIEGKKNAKSFLIGAATSTGLLHVLLFFAFGEPFFKQVYLYHVHKVQTAYLANSAEVFAFMFQAHTALSVLAGLGVLLSVRLWLHKRTVFAELRTLSILFLLLYGAFLFALKTLFLHYFLLLLPFVAIIAASAIIDFAPRIKKSVNNPVLHLPFFATLMIVLGIAVHDTVQTKDAVISVHANTGFSHAEEIAETLQSDLKPEQTIYGEFGITPILSLLSGRRIAADEVDSSVMRFTSGTSDFSEMIAAIEEDNIEAVLSREHSGITAYIPFRKYLESNFTLRGSFRTKESPVSVEYWRRKMVE